ncbi:MAG: ABC transporter ATP-binding protein [Deltaproteobacteria bacterium]|nr:MAG: ABC transporter ATP-binding protein [Deltaproteobacteria bacterium]
MIEVQGLHKSLGGQEVLKGVDLLIPDGEITVILGRSGVGKSVLLKHLIGLIRPDRGRIILDGEDITRMGERQLIRIRKRFGMLFQEGALFDSFTVAENVAFPLLEHTSLSEREIEERVREKLRQVDLEDAWNKYPSELSGGMKKRAALARALALDPDIVLCDEPTSGLDPVAAATIEKLILETQRRLSKTFVVITHDLKTALSIGSRIALLEEGKIVVEGRPEEVLKSGHPLIEAYIEREEIGKEVGR